MGVEGCTHAFAEAQPYSQLDLQHQVWKNGSRVNVVEEVVTGDSDGPRYSNLRICIGKSNQLVTYTVHTFKNVFLCEDNFTLTFRDTNLKTIITLQNLNFQEFSLGDAFPFLRII